MRKHSILIVSSSAVMMLGTHCKWTRYPKDYVALVFNGYLSSHLGDYQVSKYSNSPYWAVVFIGLLATIQLAIESPKPIKLEIVTPLGWVSLNTWKGALK